MSKPNGPIVGGVHLDDGTHTRFIWIDEQGLQNPAGLSTGTMVDTFGGPVMLAPNWASIPARKLTFPGYLLPIAQSVSITTGQREFMEWFRITYSRMVSPGIPSKVQMGNSYYRGFPGQVEITKFKSHGKLLGYSFDLTPDSGAWVQSYRSALNPGGFARIRYDTPRLERSTSSSAANLPILVNNPGDMPTKLQATISITSAIRTTRFFINVVPASGAAPKRYAVTPNSSGVVSVSETDNIILAPGDNYLRLEEANGSLITGATVYLSAYGTKVRNSNPSGPDLWPILTHSRATNAYYSTSTTSTSSQTLSFPEEARQGTIDNYSAANLGIIVESDATNVLQYSEEHDNAYWTKTNCTVPTTNITSPANTATGDRLQNTAGGVATVSRQYTATSTTRYTFSVFAKIATAATAWYMEIYNVTTATLLVSTNMTATSSWQRFSVTTPANVTSGNVIEVRIGLPLAALADIDVWGSQLEATSYRTSYIPSPSFASATDSVRAMDILHFDNPHNYLAYSNDFFRQTTTQGTAGLWFLDTGCTISNTRVAGPNIVPLIATQITFTAAGDYIEQKIINAEQLTGLTRVTLSGWVRNSSASARSSIIFRLNDRSGANISSATFVTYENWTRFSTTVSIAAGTQVDRIRIEGTGANTQYIYGFQLTKQEWNADTSSPLPECREVYTETQAAPILPDDSANDWPLWITQNGFVQFDIRNNETSRPNFEGRLLFGGFSGSVSREPLHPIVYRDTFYSSSDNAISFTRIASSGVSTLTINSGVNIYDGNWHTVRIQWRNYVLSGTRTMDITLTIDGVSTTATSNQTAWSSVPKFVFAQGRMTMFGSTYRCNSSYRNISMGVPTLPAGAIPAQY